MFGRGKTQNRAKTHRPFTSAFSALFVLTVNGTQSHSAQFLNWGDHINSVPDLAASPPWVEHYFPANFVCRVVKRQLSTAVVSFSGEF